MHCRIGLFFDRLIGHQKLHQDCLVRGLFDRPIGRTCIHHGLFVAAKHSPPDQCLGLDLICTPQPQHKACGI